MTAGTIRKAAVLGAGTMGAQIAAHIANAGVPVHLLDTTGDVAKQGFQRAHTLAPSPFFTLDSARLVTLGGFDHDLSAVAGCDWIIEAVVEQLEVKRELLAQVEPHRAPAAIVSSNTSGIPLAALAEGRGEPFRQHWLGTHFFNPPRYLKLLEVIPTADTRREVVEIVARFADLRLGKGVVRAKDTPSFIANRLGLYSVARALEQLASGQFTIEEIDALTGPLIGRPKSATFRTLDLTGLDLLVQVAHNVTERLSAEATFFTLPAVVHELVSRGWAGQKAGQGFYKRVERGGEREILTLDPASLDYRARLEPRLPELERFGALQPLEARLRSLLLDKGRAGAFTRATLGATLLYAARVAREIADSIDDIDWAMRWGFGWERGPFEIIDSIGIRELVDACHGEGATPLIDEALSTGRNRFRMDGLVSHDPALQLLAQAKAHERVVKQNVAASLIDLGDEVLCVEFHSKMNVIGGDTIAMLEAGLEQAERRFAALVVGNDGQHFSAGANLMLLLLAAQEGDWDEIDLMVRTFQRATIRLRGARVPVVVAASGMTLGGGCEVLLHADRVQAAAESYIGLVETSVGLIPAGGGTKEMLLRALAARPAVAADSLPFVQRAFETMALAKVSTSAADGRSYGFLRAVDRITMNRDRLLADAKGLALGLAQESYQPPQPPAMISIPGATVRAALRLGVHLAWRAGRISDHDAHIGRWLAHVLAGGDLPAGTPVGEQYLLDLEREAFLSLCGERKTQERIAHMLKTGKPLRN
ncbi:MAG: 3-hydroxyacyl-CoA dehydrogenase/enoyl-CoA hydratase family protein [Luteitalea sp.]|nr:3-hydroxyacyl-CoA dehydrogenase/enoyl-CoA hydratase family protein [Luteitalea sp.]